ncbi:peroxiredoxin family protein [Chitinilyticum litopenaei]|uniref:peroxiredoxin family protein n=1 Tax=Chitinilyticum litopenaei TaxID=1121276 RepID=UPI0004138EDE|nr:TlpA disulfide reductase family protein [Chitinilyticum litopenaei]
MKQRLFLVLALLAITASMAALLLLNRQSPAPALQLTLLDQRQLALQDLRGKVVLVNFWATSCSGCMAEMPDLTRIQNKYAAQGYQTVAIAMSYDQREFIDTYQARAQLPFLISHDVSGSAAEAFGGVSLTPTTFLIDKEGKILQKYVGTPDMQELENRIGKALRI